MSNSISTYNQLEAKSFDLVIDRLPNVTYHCTSAPLPGLSTTAPIQHTPFAPAKHHGDTIVFQPLIVTFIIDENMANWREMFDWFISFTHPSSFDQYKQNTVNPALSTYQSKFSDGTLEITNNKYNIKNHFRFTDLTPVDISDVVFDVQFDGTTVSICTVTFEYTVYYPLHNI